MKKWYQKSMAVLTAAACLFAGGTIGLARDSLPQLQLTAEAANTYIGAAYGLQLEYEELEDGTVEITKFVSSSSTDIELPSVIDGKSVTSIGYRAFDADDIKACSNLTSIVIPDNVVSIGDYAFRGCTSLADVTIPDSVISIGDSAFKGCTSLTNITIPDSVISIGDSAFKGCTSLTNIIIPDSVISIGIWAFSDCTNVESVIISKNIVNIKDSVFFGCSSLVNITIPNNVINIGERAFEGCGSLTNITIPKNVASIGNEAFGVCSSLTEIIVDSDNKSYASKDGVLFDKDLSTIIRCPSKKSGSFTIPDSVTSIGSYAFEGCGDLKSIIIPKNVTTIEDGAFWNCKDLTNITIPDNVTSIGDSVFWNCRSLTSITIPDNVTSIGNSAFFDCSSLTNITISDSVTSIGGSAFANCTNLTDIYYKGTESQWNQISIGSSAIPSNVTIHYESNPVTTTTTTTTTTKPITTTTKPITTTTLTTTTTTPIITTTTTTTTTTKDHTFTPGADNWSFLNSHSNFGYGNYFMLDSYYNKLVDGLNNLEKYHVDDLLESSWGGSCYGMATTSILAADGILIPSNWQDDATFLNDIDAPPSDEVKSLINYYMALQATDTIRNQTNKFLYLTEKEKLQVLVDCLEDHSPTLLTFFGSYWGHAVVAYDLQYGTYSINGTAYNGKVLIYDNNDNTFDDNYCLYFNTSKGTWTIPEYDDAYQLGFITDYTGFINYHGYIDTSDVPVQSTADSFIATLQSNLLKSNYSLTKINLNQNKNTYTFSTTDPNEIRTFSDFSDSMEANNLKFAMKDASKGYALKLATTEAVDLSMRYENSIFDVTGSNGNIAVFDPSGYVSLEGSDTTYNFNMIYNDGYHTTDWYSFQVDGNHVDAANMKQTENGYVLHADSLSNVTAQAYNENATAKVTFSTDYTDVLLYEIDEETIGVAVDTNGDGTYETTIAKSDDTSEDTIMYGDVNGNNLVEVSDAVEVLKYYARKAAGLNSVFSETSSENEAIFKLADVNKDGEITVQDAVLILTYYAKTASGGQPTWEELTSA